MLRARENARAIRTCDAFAWDFARASGNLARSHGPYCLVCAPRPQVVVAVIGASLSSLKSLKRAVKKRVQRREAIREARLGLI